MRGDGISDTAVQAFRERLLNVCLIRTVAIFVSVWALAWGTVALVLKEVLGVGDATLAWGCTTLVPVLIWAVVRARRQLPSPSVCRAALDHLNQAGGLVMAQAETALDDWSGRVPHVTQPDISWRGHGKASACVASCLFVGSVFLLPHFDLNPIKKPRLDVRNNVEELDLKIQTLEETGLLEEEKSQTLRDELMKAWKDSNGADPVKTWETLDHVEKSLDQLAQEDAANLIQDAGKAALAEQLAKSLDDALKKEDSAVDGARALRELAAAMDKLGVTGLPSLPKDLADAIASLHLSQEQLAKLSQCMSQCTNGCSKALSKMAQSKMINADSLKMLDEALACNQAKLDEFLKRQESGCKTLCQAGLCTKPGNGGVDRGRGDAPMTWTDPSSDAGTAFKEKALAPAAITSLEQSQLTGMSLVAPDVPDADAAKASAGALVDAQASGGSANTQPLLPRHKSAVTRYFERENP